MDIKTLREKVATLETKLAERGDEKKVLLASKSGPVGIEIIKTILEHLVAQDARIEELEKKLAEK